MRSCRPGLRLDIAALRVLVLVGDRVELSDLFGFLGPGVKDVCHANMATDLAGRPFQTGGGSGDSVLVRALGDPGACTARGTPHNFVSLSKALCGSIDPDAVGTWGPT